MNSVENLKALSEQVWFASVVLFFGKEFIECLVYVEIFKESTLLTVLAVFYGTILSLVFWKKWSLAIVLFLFLVTNFVEVVSQLTGIEQFYSSLIPLFIGTVVNFIAFVLAISNLYLEKQAKNSEVEDFLANRVKVLR